VSRFAARGVVVALLAAAIGSILRPSPALATFPGANGLIAFVRGGDIYTMRPDGTHQHRLTSSGWDATPTWAPDGRQLAFARLNRAQTQWNLFVMGADGGHLRELPTGNLSAYGPGWSPDGQTIAFAGGSQGVDFLYAISTTSPTAKPVMLGSSQIVVSGFDSVAWSPDGKTIVFAGDDTVCGDNGSDTCLYSFSTVTKQAKVVFFGGEGCNGPAPESPDFGPMGSHILFVDVAVASCEFVGASLQQMNPDGSGLVTIDDPHTPVDDGPGAFSPDKGQEIVFTRYRCPGFTPCSDSHIVVAQASGQDQKVIARGSDPVWQSIP
jgi:Tol biopolymer transport system component